MAHRILYTLRLITLFSLTQVGIGQEQSQPAEALPGQRLVSITDVDTKGQTETIRAEMKFDQHGRRLTNKVFDRQEQIVGTERFQYDSNGKLSRREYLTADAKLKWRWQRFQYNDAGKPVRNDIVNRKGRKIGWYFWRYDEQGRLTRRDRFNADGTLRFYYDDMKLDERGNFSTWTKFNGKGVKIGLKTWEYAAQ